MSSETPASVPGATPPPRGALARNVLIGCGVVAIVAVVAVIAFLLYVRRNPASLTDLMMKQIESHYAADVTPEQKQDLRAAYADFRRAIAERRVQQNAMQKIQITFSSSTGRELTSEQVRTLAAAFREAAGAASPSPPPPSPKGPAPSATPSP